jgi:hypothetical protein
MGAFGGLLLCIHWDLDLHIDGNPELGISCMDEAQDQACGTENCLSEGKPCVDVELVAEQLPVTRLKSDNSFKQIQDAPVLALIEALWLTEFPCRLLYKKIATRAPPRVYWQTNDHIQTTVLRV